MNDESNFEMSLADMPSRDHTITSGTHLEVTSHSHMTQFAD